MTAPLNALLGAIRRAGISGSWTAGIKLAREGAVFGRTERGEGISVQVRARGETGAARVTLYPADVEWTCDCRSLVDPCAHVAAAIIVLTQAKEQGRALPAVEQGAKLRYRLRHRGGVLALDRFVVKGDGTQEVLRGSLAGAGGRGVAAGIQPGPEDLVIDRIVGARADGVVAAARVGELFAALAGVGDVRLEDRVVKVSGEVIAPHAVVVAQGEGAALVIERDPRITEVVGGGMALIGQTLFALAATEITGTRLERLPLRRVFGQDELGRLAREVVPDVGRSMAVEVRVNLLQPERDLGPRVTFTVAQGARSAESITLEALGALFDDLEVPRPLDLSGLAPLIVGFAGLPAAALPADLTATLRPYQQKGVDWLSFLRDAGLGAVLADDMGLGKTLQTLAAIRGRTLVVCPRSVVHNWAAELRRFRPGLKFSIYHGPKRALDGAAEVTLTTYSLLRLDAEALGREAWDTVVLDEAQAIKNPESQVARAAHGLRGGFRVALSGTPVENRLEELWSLLQFTSPGLLGGRRAFEERFARPIAAGAPGAADRLRARIRPFVLRRLKREVAPELPPRTESVLYCELDEGERAIYEGLRAATRAEVVAKLGAGGGVMAALEALLRLRQAACHPGLLPGREAESSAKVERLVDSLEDAAADGHKALVFSQWTALLDRVEPHLVKAGIRFTRLDGATADRAAVVAQFQEESGPPVMLLSLKAGGTGLNLTAADHVFLLDPWWNPAAESQAADRAHRIGQDKPVSVYRLVSKDTVEEGILALQERKRALADTALEAADRAVSLTREDLLELLA